MEARVRVHLAHLEAQLVAQRRVLRATRLWGWLLTCKGGQALSAAPYCGAQRRATPTLSLILHSFESPLSMLISNALFEIAAGRGLPS